MTTPYRAGHVAAAVTALFSKSALLEYPFRFMKTIILQLRCPYLHSAYQGFGVYNIQSIIRPAYLLLLLLVVVVVVVVVTACTVVQAVV